MRDNFSQLLSSILLGSVSFISNDALRYTALSLAAGLIVIHAIHFKRPSVQLSQLEDGVRKTEEIIRDAKVLCPRDLVSLTTEGLQLLE
jgi:hypothetical protein